MEKFKATNTNQPKITDSANRNETVQTVTTSEVSRDSAKLVFNATDLPKAELLWVFRMVEKNSSFSSSNDVSKVFTEMFLDSEIAKHFTCGKTKAQYLLNFCLALHQMLTNC